MAQNLKACVIQIRDTHNLVHGTGFLIDAKTAVTCSHVVEAAGGVPGGSVTISFALADDTCSAEVVADAWRPTDRDDIAILKLQDASPSDAVPAILGRTDQTQRHSFQAFGYPKVGDMQGVWAEGMIRGPITDSRGTKMLQLHSQEMARGMSGAPVLDTRDDRVVGMVTAIYVPGQTSEFRDAAFATPMETVAQTWTDAMLVPPPSVWERMRQLSPVVKMLAAVGILIGLLLVAMLVFTFPDVIERARQPGGLIYQLYPASTSTPTPLPPMSGGFNIAVAQFTTLDNTTGEQTSTPESQELSEWLFNVVDREAQEFRDSSLSSLSFEVRGPDQTGPILGQDQATRDDNARKVAEQHNATLVVYGVVVASDDGYVVQPEFYVSEKGFRYGDEIVGPNRLGQPVPFEPPLDTPGTLLGVNEELDARVEALRHIVSGLASFYVNRNEEAYGKFKEAARVPNWQSTEGLEVVYLLMGAAQLRLFGDPESDSSQRTDALAEAQKSFERAAELNPDYARSYLGLGGVALSQASQFNSERSRIVGVEPAKLAEARDWYVKSLGSDVDQPPSAYVPVKAVYALGQLNLAGSTYGHAGWSKEKAQHFFNEVITAYDESGQAADLRFLAGSAHLRLALLADLEEDWPTMVSECNEANDIFNSLDINRPYDQIASCWAAIGFAQEKLDQLDAACQAYSEAIQIGEDANVPVDELNRWKAALDLLAKGAPSLEPCKR